MRKSFIALIFLAFCSMLIAQQALNNDSVIKLVKAGLSDDLIITTVNVMPGSYDTTPDGLIALKSAGASIAIYSSRTGYYIHAKTVLADYGTALASLFVGSENFSTYSLDKNRELGLIFSDPGCLAGVEAAISADYNGGTKF